MKYSIYVLQSVKDQRFYTGMAKDLRKRLEEHNQGKVTSTKLRIPFKLIYSEEVSDRKLARVREKYWKSGAGREKIKKMLTADLPLGKS